MFRFVTSLVSALFSGLRSRRDLILENLALRQQRATILQKHQPRIRPADRLFWVLMRRFWSKWADNCHHREAQDRHCLASNRLLLLLEVAVQVAERHRLPIGSMGCPTAPGGLLL